MLKLSSAGILVLFPSCWSSSVSGSLGGLWNRRLPATSLRDSSSSKDNLIETRTKITVGAMPYPGKCYLSVKHKKQKWIDLIITLNISLIPMIKFEAILKPTEVGPLFWDSGRLENTTRTSWMTSNAIPDSIIINIICRSVVSSVELNVPNVCSTEVGLTPKNTLRILNTINPVTRVFTAMDAAKPVRNSVYPQGALKSWSGAIVTEPFDANQTAKRR